jgi:pseudouridine synthase
MTDKNPEKKERLQVVLARFGIASRRGVVALIESGRVLVNGVPVIEKGHRVDAVADKIIVDGNALDPGLGQKKRYFVIHKPKGVMTTMQDPHAERTVADFFKDIPERLVPVGRLDRDTTGLLLMTNDGELAFRLTHPRYGVKKKYKVLVSGRVSMDAIKRLEKGVCLEEGETAPCEITVIQNFSETARSAASTLLSVTLHEGKKRQIRRIFQHVGYHVLELERTHYGPLFLGEMRVGARRELERFEIRQLEAAAGLAAHTAGN